MTYPGGMSLWERPLKTLVDRRKERYLCAIAKRDTVILLIDADYLFAAGDLEQILDAAAESPQLA